MPATVTTASDRATADEPRRLIRIFERRYFFVLAAVACLVVLDQSVVQPLLVQMDAYAPTINVAGRQRMLSQRLTKAALKWQAAVDQQAQAAQLQELATTRRDWANAHMALEDGQGELSLPALKVPAVDAAWSKLQPHFAAMNEAAEALAELKLNEQQLPTNSSQWISAIAEHEGTYLSTMEQVVALLEREATAQIHYLRIVAIAIATAVLCLLAALGWLVVRPATRIIDNQVEQLETRVAMRTSELASANASLEREICEHAAAEEKTQSLAAQLAHASRVSAMGHLTAGLSHELSQPLTAIVNYAETCKILLDQTRNDDDKLHQHFEQIRHASARAGNILHRMRDFVRPSRGALVPVNLNKLILEVAELCKFESDRADVRVRCELGSQIEVVADAIQIQQVLVNLLQNALRAILTSDSELRCVTIRATPSADDVRVEVVDTGPGLDGIAEAALFTPFFTTRVDGLGLGLAISKTILDRHHGKMFATNSPQGGAIIGFILPRAVESNRDASANQMSNDFATVGAETC